MKLPFFFSISLISVSLISLSSCDEQRPNPNASALQPVGDALMGTWIIKTSSGDFEHLSFSEMNPDASGLATEERLVDGEVVSYEMASYRVHHNPLLSRGERITLELNFFERPANRKHKLTLLSLDGQKLVLRNFYSPATFTYRKR